MKSVIFTLVLSVLTVSVQASQLPQCLTNTATAVVTIDGQKNLGIQGNGAKELYEAMSTEAVAADSRSFSEIVFNAKIKSSGNVNCWNYEASLIVSGKSTGKPAGCQIFVCNIALSAK